MTDKELTAMTDTDFENLLQEEISELPPPEDLVHSITPWRKAFGRILWGLGLTSITLNFFHLNITLPSIGIALMLLGFRALRKENGWFRAAWYITLFRCALHLFILLANTTIYSEVLTAWLSGTAVGTLFTVVSSFGIPLCLWGGIRAVQRKAGLTPHAFAAAALAVLHLLPMLLQGRDGIWVLLFLAPYPFIIWGLVRLSRELDVAGYAITPARTKFPDALLATCLGAALCVGLLLCGTFGNRYPMNWQEHTTGHTAAETVKQELLDRGFPENVLSDLTEEEILAFRDARRILHTSARYDGAPMDMLRTGVAVLLAGETEHWQVIHHFQWAEDPGFRGTEALRLWSSEAGWQLGSGLGGRVLYDRDGAAHTAAYYALEAGTDGYVYAEFSLPEGGENHRCYITFDLYEVQDGYPIDSYCYYIHQTAPAVPPRTARDWASLIFHPSGFEEARSRIYFYPNDPYDIP